MIVRDNFKTQQGSGPLDIASKRPQFKLFLIFLANPRNRNVGISTFLSQKTNLSPMRDKNSQQYIDQI